MTEDIRFEKRVAAITGAGSGLGRAYAHYLAARGARVVVNDRGVAPDGRGGSDGPARKVADEILAAGGEAVADFGDVTDPVAMRGMAALALDRYGSLDILIAQAGVLRDKTFLKMPLEDFEHVVRVHLMGTVNAVKAAYPAMVERGYGRIVFATSVSGLFGNFGQTNYAAAKLGIVGFMNALKLEGAKHNILVNTIAPLGVTRLGAATFNETIAPRLKPELVAAMVAYLASDQCRSSGDVISAAAGHYTRVQMMQGKGVRFAPEEAVTPETIAARFGAIVDMSGAVPFGNAAEAVREIMEPSL
jgi:NAD(P)-dependent dehydrogenase (short-subunit alcohol dehydrogenase family)